MGVTRREWVAALAASAAARAQSDHPPETPEEELAAARERQRGSLKTLDKFELPMSAEPAFRFEA
jgi:hypothetical protein